MEHEMDVIMQNMVDGNVASGIFVEIFGTEMTAAPTECASCGQAHQVGTLMAFTQAPGIVLRCPSCESVMVRIVQTPDAIYLDARGAAYLRIART